MGVAFSGLLLKLSVRDQDDFPSGTQRYGDGRRQQATIATNGVRKKGYAGSSGWTPNDCIAALAAGKPFGDGRFVFALAHPPRLFLGLLHLLLGQRPTLDLLATGVDRVDLGGARAQRLGHARRQPAHQGLVRGDTIRGRFKNREAFNFPTKEEDIPLLKLRS